MIFFKRASLMLALITVLGLGSVSLSRADDIVSHCSDLFEEWNECRESDACRPEDKEAIRDEAIEAGCFLLIMIWP